MKRIFLIVMCGTIGAVFASAVFAAEFEWSFGQPMVVEYIGTQSTTEYDWSLGAPAPIFQFATTPNEGTSTPAISAIIINNGSPIILTANTTTSVSVNFTVTDSDGCSDVFTSGRVTSTLYRSGASSTCATDNPVGNTLFCYAMISVTSNCSGGSSANATATFDVWYFAQATDASSSYANETWGTFISVRDSAGATSTTSTVSVELLTLVGFDVQSSTAYGTVPAGENTSSTNQTVWVKNAGNSSSTLRLAGTALTSGGNSIPTSSQHYATSSFTFGGTEQQLQGSATDVPGFLISRPPLTSWATTTALPSSTQYSLVLTNNHYIYAIGGGDAGQVATATVLFAPISATGTIGTWTTTTPLPNAVIGPAGGIKDSYIYSAGGQLATGIYTSTVLYAPISATGSIGVWTSTTPLPYPSGNHALIYNDYFYAVGGFASTSPFQATSSVFFAPIAATGSVGTWASTTALPHPTGTATQGIVANNGYLYVIGGMDGGFTATTTVLYAPINATGSVGSWTTTTPLPSAGALHAAVVDQGIVYLIGNSSSTVRFAPFQANGTIGTWSETAPVPIGSQMGMNVAVWNGNLYTVGGNPNGAEVATTTVLTTPLASKNTYWGLEVPAGTPQGVFTGVNTFTAVWSP